MRGISSASLIKKCFTWNTGSMRYGRYTSRKDTRASSHDGPGIPATRECCFSVIVRLISGISGNRSATPPACIFQRIDFAPFREKSGKCPSPCAAGQNRLWRIFPSQYYVLHNHNFCYFWVFLAESMGRRQVRIRWRVQSAGGSPESRSHGKEAEVAMPLDFTSVDNGEANACR